MEVQTSQPPGVPFLPCPWQELPEKNTTYIHIDIYLYIHSIYIYIFILIMCVCVVSWHGSRTQNDSGNSKQSVSPIFDQGLGRWFRCFVRSRSDAKWSSAAQGLFPEGLAVGPHVLNSLWLFHRKVLGFNLTWWCSICLLSLRSINYLSLLQNCMVGM